jgi:pSer/pThr/pTyr-binding forkhead associated (FHA) protein
MARFLIEEKGRPTRAYKLVTDAIIIGRIDTADLVLPDQDVSRKHALVERAESGWVLSDNGSANGTTVNGVAVEQHRLADGDVVIMGKFTLTFRTEDAGDQPDYTDPSAEDANDALTNPGSGDVPPPPPAATSSIPTLVDSGGEAHPVGSGLSFGADLPVTGVLPFVSPGTIVAEGGGAGGPRGARHRTN